MKLAVVDVGNTSTAVGLWTDGRVTRVSHCDGGYREAAALPIWKTPNLDGLAYVSVVPKADRGWKSFAKGRNLRIHQISHLDFPLKFDYPKPETVGADRLADAAGAVARYGAPVVVMDFGTALTASAVTADRVWRGGVIAPGFPLMRDYLFERTAKLPRMKIGSGKAPKIGRSTEEAMRFGALVGYRGMVREIVTELRRNFAADFRLVATGGFAKWVLQDLDLPFTVDPTLTLYGAGLVASETFKVKSEKRGRLKS